MMDHEIVVVCEAVDAGWHCDVTVGTDDAATEHEVSVDSHTLLSLAGGGDPSDLVRASFQFLLEREPRTSIMRSFELPLIGRFFPDYETEIRQRVQGR